MGFLSDLFKSTPSVDYKTLIASGARVVDVRSPQEFQSGHAKGSLNIPLDTLDKNMKTIKGLKGPVILVCRSGNRASSALNILKKNGLEAVNAGAWQNVK